ncbi:kinase-like domain-containing protein [Spinellus fusiger]|nr:kinase-like domain-containing protein [Spinellus fusiger]
MDQRMSDSVAYSTEHPPHQEASLPIRRSTLHRLLSTALRQEHLKRSATTTSTRIKVKRERERERKRELEVATPQGKPLSRHHSLSEKVTQITSFLWPTPRRMHSHQEQLPPHSPQQEQDPANSSLLYSTLTTDYEIIRAIGSGATAKVYSAVYQPTASLVAIKTVLLTTLDRSRVGEASRLDRVRKEIQIMSLCRHPHLLPVYQSFVSCSLLYIVMPIMSAGSCHSLLVDNSYYGLQESLVACILRQALLGLDYFHSNNLVHRDLKSANLLIDYASGIVKLADFGVSDRLVETPLPDSILSQKQKKDGSILHLSNAMDVLELSHSTDLSFKKTYENNTVSFSDSPSPTRTHKEKEPTKSPSLSSSPSTSSSSPLPSPAIKKASRRSFVGTPCWMAPEILLDQAYDTKVDLWSLGMTAIELASGRPFCWYLDPFKIFTMIVRDPPPTLQGNGCRYPPSCYFEDFVGCCLVKESVDRISASEALSHPFIRKAQGPHLLAQYLAQRPEMNKAERWAKRRMTKVKKGEQQGIQPLILHKETTESLSGNVSIYVYIDINIDKHGDR